jgi:hypothetical protein
MPTVPPQASSAFEDGFGTLRSSTNFHGYIQRRFFVDRFASMCWSILTPIGAEDEIRKSCG